MTDSVPPHFATRCKGNATKRVVGSRTECALVPKPNKEATGHPSIGSLSVVSHSHASPSDGDTHTHVSTIHVVWVRFTVAL